MIYSCSSTDDIFFHLPHISYNCTSPIWADAKGQIWPKACSLTEVSREAEGVCCVMNELLKVSTLQNILYICKGKQEMENSPLNTSSFYPCVESERITGTQARCDTEPYGGTRTISHRYYHDLWFFLKKCALELILPLPTATGFRFRDLKANSVVLNLGFGLQVSCYEWKYTEVIEVRMLEKGMFLNVSFTMLFEEKGKKKVNEPSNDYFK